MQHNLGLQKPVRNLCRGFRATSPVNSRACADDRMIKPRLTSVRMRRCSCGLDTDSDLSALTPTAAAASAWPVFGHVNVAGVGPMMNPAFDSLRAPRSRGCPACRPTPFPRPLGLSRNKPSRRTRSWFRSVVPWPASHHGQRNAGCGSGPGTVCAQARRWPAGWWPSVESLCLHRR